MAEVSASSCAQSSAIIVFDRNSSLTDIARIGPPRLTKYCVMSFSFRVNFCVMFGLFSDMLVPAL